jgi:GAF domain-containing protein
MEQAVVEARVEMTVALNDSLAPIIRHVGRAATVDDPVLRLIGPDRTRACWFNLLKHQSPQRLVPADWWGRGTEPTTVFDRANEPGRTVFQLLEHGEARIYKDLDKVQPPGWTNGERKGYKTFISVPVLAGKNVYGLLTIDAPAAGDLREENVPLMRLLAGILANALAICRPGSIRVPERVPARPGR